MVGKQEQSSIVYTLHASANLIFVSTNIVRCWCVIALDKRVLSHVSQLVSQIWQFFSGHLPNVKIVLLGLFAPPNIKDG
jgi:hypothetical protein